MPVTYKLIATTTVSTATAANIEFTNIPATYDDIVMVLSLRGNNSAELVETKMTYNGNASNYSERLLYGTGSGVASVNRTGTYFSWGANAVAATSTASTFSNVEVYIPNYAGSNNKSASHTSVTENNATAARIYADASLWSNTAAITSITLIPEFDSYVQHSTAYLYGIKKS